MKDQINKNILILKALLIYGAVRSEVQHVITTNKDTIKIYGCVVYNDSYSKKPAILMRDTTLTSLKYLGNNSFEGGVGYPKARFEVQLDGSVKVFVERSPGKDYTGVKYLKYS